jgi:hypothetical protein
MAPREQLARCLGGRPGPVRDVDLIVYDFHHPMVTGPAKDISRKACPAETVHPVRPDDQVLASRVLHRPLAFELGAPIRIERIRGVRLDVGEPFLSSNT